MDQHDYFQVMKTTLNLKGASVLEVGGSISPRVAREAGIAKWTSINVSDRWLPKGEECPDWYVAKNMSATNMDFPTGTFDYVFSSNCFEHVDDIRRAFGEICRVLKPGGVFFTIFGPIWSGPVGHHTWIHRDDGTTLTFNDRLFPPWSHLLYGPEDMGMKLTFRYTSDEVNRILRYVYDSKDLNRNIDAAYEEAIKPLRFKQIIKHRIRSNEPLSPSLDRLLRDYYEDVIDFRTTGFFWVLAKDKWNPLWTPMAYLRAGWALARAKFRR